MEHNENQRNGIIAVVGLIGGLMVIVTLIAGASYFQQVRFKKVYQRVMAAQNPALLQLHTEEQAILNSYAWKDKDNGVVRVPIERAMELVARESGERGQDGN